MQTTCILQTEGGDEAAWGDEWKLCFDGLQDKVGSVSGRL